MAASSISIMRACAACFVPRRASFNSSSSSCYATTSSSPAASSASSSAGRKPARRHYRNDKQQHKAAPPPPRSSAIVVATAGQPSQQQHRSLTTTTSSSTLKKQQEQQTAAASSLLLQRRGGETKLTLSSHRQAAVKTVACCIIMSSLLLVLMLNNGNNGVVDGLCTGECAQFGRRHMEMLQIEKIKQTILDKLRLARPPRIAPERRMSEQVVRQMLLAASEQQPPSLPTDMATNNNLLDIAGNNDEQQMLLLPESQAASAMAAPPTTTTTEGEEEEENGEQPARVGRFKSLSRKQQHTLLAPPTNSLMPDDEPSNSIAEFYAKNAEILLVAENASLDCTTMTSDNNNGMCVAFSVASLMQQQLAPDSIDRAMLYIPMSQVRPLGHQIRISSPSRHINTIYTIGRNGEDTGFMPVDITEHVQHWLRTGQRHWRVHIHCNTCGGTTPLFSSSSRMSLSRANSNNVQLRPYLSLFPRDRNRKHRRDRRAADCVAEMDTCCRKELLIDFSSIGWDQWILHPKEYQAYYCHGSCNSGIHFPQSEWSMIMQHRMNVATETSTTPPELPMQVPICCSPTRMSSLSLLYYDEDGNILKARMPNMIVDECGCS